MCFSRMATIMLLVASQAAFGDEAIRALLSQYRRELVDEHRLMFGIAGQAPTGQKVRALGVKVLPDMVEFLGHETDPPMREYLADSIRHRARFEVYKYSDVPFEFPAEGQERLDTEKGNLPFLSIQISPSNSCGNTSELIPKTLAWWDRRDEFLKRPPEEVESTIRRLLGSCTEDYERFDWKAYRAFRKSLGAYGIYNLPYYIDVILSDNNPILFTLLLWDFHPGYYPAVRIPMDMLQGLLRLGNAFPTVKDKHAVISAWWQEQKELFEVLPDLQAAIQREIDRFGEAEVTAPSLAKPESTTE